MTMTEEQAKTKWCPYARTMSVAHYGKEQMTTPAFNRVALGTQEETITRNPSGCNCIASECMAWRKRPSLMDPQVRVEKVKAHRNATGCTLKEAVDWVDAQAPEFVTGYCGLAGAP